MNSLYLTEAFKELNLLEEETFNTNSEEDMSDFKDLVTTEDDVVNIIDAEAKTDEELEDSYVGKVVLDCDVCHSKIYKDPESVIISGEEHANEGEECPYCYSTDGYKIIGQIEPYQEESELKVEVEDKDDVDIDDLDDVEDSEDFDVEEKEEEITESFQRNRDRKKSIKESRRCSNKKLTEKLKRWEVEMFLSKVYQLMDDAEDLDDDEYDTRANELCDISGIDRASLDEVVWGPPFRDEEDIIDILRESIELKESVNDGLAKSELISQLKEEGFPKYASILANYDVEVLSNSSKEAKFDAGNKKFIFGSDVTSEEAIKFIMNKIKHQTDADLAESFDRVELETPDKIIKVSEEEKPVIPDEEMIAPLEDETKFEMEDNSEEMIDEPTADEESEADVEDEGELVDQDIDEFDEEEFDDLGESYLKRVYENVANFKTSKVSTKGNTLKVEGIIKFKSGAQKNTTFLFEAKDITNSGKVRFVGENLQISRGKKSFTLTGSLSKGKLISESLNYNYRTKDASGKSIRLYGTIKR